MSGRKKLAIAMIGYGFMGRAHSNAFRGVGSYFPGRVDLQRKVICGRNRDAVEEMAAQWGWDEVATDWESLVARNDIDVVDICTPNYLHAPIAEAAARTGKIVWCEKPLAMSTEEAARMSDVARNVPTLVWFNYRRVPAIRLAKNLVEAGKLGEIYHYSAVYLQSWGSTADPEAWRFKPSEAGSGVMGDLLSHSIDLALWLNGAISEVTALTKTFAPGRKVDDAVQVMARFANHSIGSFEATRYATGCRNRNGFEIHGSKGAIRFDLEDLNRLEFFDASDSAEIQGFHRILVTEPQHPYTAHFWPPGHIIGYEHTFIAAVADFLHSLEQDVPFHPNFEDSVPVHRVLEAVERSAMKGAWASIPA